MVILYLLQELKMMGIRFHWFIEIQPSNEGMTRLANAELA